MSHQHPTPNLKFPEANYTVLSVFFRWYMGLNSGFHTFKTGALSLQLHLQPSFTHIYFPIFSYTFQNQAEIILYTQVSYIFA
jgi:hypothetical protein